MTIASKGKAAQKAATSAKAKAPMAPARKRKPKAEKLSVAKETQDIKILVNGKTRVYQYTMTNSEGIWQTHKHTFAEVLSLAAHNSIQSQSMSRVVNAIFCAEYGPNWIIELQDKTTKLGKRIDDRIEQFRELVKQKAKDARKDIESGEKKRPAVLAAVAVSRLKSTALKAWNKANKGAQPKRNKSFAESAIERAIETYKTFARTSEEKLTTKDKEFAVWFAAGIKHHYGIDIKKRAHAKQR